MSHLLYKAWKKVEELLPPPGVKVLGYIPQRNCFSGGKRVVFDIVDLQRDYYGPHNMHDSTNGPSMHKWRGPGPQDYWFPEVTHWKPLPKTPEEEIPYYRRSTDKTLRELMELCDERMYDPSQKVRSDLGNFRLLIEEILELRANHKDPKP